MNKFLKSLDLCKIQGKTITDAKGKIYTIYYADKKDDELRTVLVDLNGAESNIAIKESLEELDSFIKQPDKLDYFFNNFDNPRFWRLDFALVKIKNPLLRVDISNKVKKENEPLYPNNRYASVYRDLEVDLNRRDSSLYDSTLRLQSRDFYKIENLEKELEGTDPLTRGLRNIFEEELGEEYTKELKSYYVDLTRRVVLEDKKDAQENIDRASRVIKSADETLDKLSKL